MSEQMPADKPKKRVEDHWSDDSCRRFSPFNVRKDSKITCSTLTCPVATASINAAQPTTTRTKLITHTRCILNAKNTSGLKTTCYWSGWNCWTGSGAVNNNITNRRKGPFSLIVIQLLLPLLIVFLLPTIKLNHHQQDHTEITLTQRAHCDGELMDHSLISPLILQAPGAFLALARLPLDRLRFAVGLVNGADAHETSDRQDLQEEETMQLMSNGGGNQHYHGYTHLRGQPMNQHLVMRSPPQRATASHEMAGAAYQSHGGVDPASAEGPGGDIISVPGGGAEQTGGVTPGALQADQPPGALVEGGDGHAVAGSSSGAGLQTRADLPAVRALNVKCEKNHMTVNIVFDRPFYGLVFSKGHYNDQKCVHLPANSGQTSVSFDIHLGKCGMSSSDASGNPNALLQHQQQQQQQLAASSGQQAQPTGLYIENTIIIQYDPQVQEIYDQARKLRCTWYDYYEKSVTFRPYNVDMLDAVTANFLGDNIQCWMQIQVGKGPWSSEVAGIVKIGQTMTMVLAIKDDENRFDMLVRNCVAHDGKHAPIQLVDEYGCVARPKIMGKFQKVRNFGPAATVVSYAHFQAFKFPDSMSVHFQCVIQVCRYECPEPACNGQPQTPGGGLSQGGGGGGNHISDQSGSDYTASGTEIVSAKEAMPLSAANSYLANGSLYGHHHQSSIQQVKLDASMLAGSSGAATGSAAGRSVASATGGATSSGGVPINAGPLPPHLLHTAASQDSPSAATRGTYLSAGASSAGPSFARGQPARPIGPQAAPPVPALNGRPPLLSMRASGPMAPSQRGPGGHFSSPYQTQSMTSPAGHHHLHQRSYINSASLTQRLGELSPQPSTEPSSGGGGSGSGSYDDDEKDDSVNGTSNNIGHPAPVSVDEHLRSSSSQQPEPLSLIGSPRGMRVGVAVATGTHRERRSVASKQELANSSTLTRGARSAGQQAAASTDVRTQKSIQVVSPDDVAFSLIEPGEDFAASDFDAFANQQQQNNYLVQQQQRPNAPISSSSSSFSRRPIAGSNVCFSATKLMLAILVTLVTLAVSIVIVAYVVIKQRARLASDKLAHATTGAIYQSAASSMSSQMECMQQEAAKQQQCQRQQQQHHHQVSGAPTCSAAAAAVAAEELLLAARQREELEQRNNCLARLYSQFVPANYWRANHH